MPKKTALRIKSALLGSGLGNKVVEGKNVLFPSKTSSTV